MRRIVSKKESKSKERFNQILVGSVLIFLLFVSIIGYGLIGLHGGGGGGQDASYDNYNFVNHNGFWLLDFGGIQFVFRYHPDEVEEIPTGFVKSINGYQNSPLYIDSISNEATGEIANNLGQLAERIQAACLVEEGCAEELPIKTCEDNFIIIRDADLSTITQSQNCVFIEGPRENLTRITDEFLFKAIGIRE